MPTVNLEPVGVLMFVLALGHGVVGGVVRGEAELLAVQRELEAARQIQRSLLPREAPGVRGLDVAVRFVPMSAVAGDLYDFVDLGPPELEFSSRMYRDTASRPQSSHRWSSSPFPHKPIARMIQLMCSRR